jgi:transcriptional regulator with XRE-family HTH domain
MYKEGLQMHIVEDLFDKRSVVGTRLEQILKAKNCTKAELCKSTGISRPTLDKLLAATLTNKTNYNKHISKILDYLGMTPDLLLGNITNSYSRIRQIRNIMKIATKDVAKATGISLKRLKKIEAGEKATVAELRDIAMCLSTGVRDLSGENVFETQVAELNLFTEMNEEATAIGLSGFWGHIGVLLNNTNEYLWYPITGNTKSAIESTMEDKRMVIPCMNNKLLFLNMSNVKEIILLDEACDQPDNTNWDIKVSCGEIPLVVFDALDDYVVYMDEDIYDEKKLSKKLVGCLKQFTEEKKWTEEDIYAILDSSSIYFSDGQKQITDIIFDRCESISSEIFNVYNLGDSDDIDNVLCYEDVNGAERIINMKRISMLELPLLKVEDAIINLFPKEAMGEGANE